MDMKMAPPCPGNVTVTVMCLSGCSAGKTMPPWCSFEEFLGAFLRIQSSPLNVHVIIVLVSVSMPVKRINFLKTLTMEGK